MSGSKPIAYLSRAAPPEPLKRLAEVCDIRVWPKDSFIPKEQLMEQAKGASVLFVHPPDPVDAEVLDAIGEIICVCVCVCVCVCL
jgi:lactate dehydrogenase-like 2-hydroxyacid dehydrogenase